MTLTKNGKVQEFLDKIRQDDADKFKVLKTLREIVFKIHPETTDRMMYGGIMFTAEGEDFGGVFVRTSHLSFELGNGVLFDDP